MTAQKYSQPMNTNPTIENQRAAVSVGSDRLLGVLREIAETEAAIKPLAAKLERLNREKRDLQSRAFITANNIRRADVEMSDGPGKPYFGHIADFVEWLKEHSDKNWAEWNTRIYRMSDLKAGRMPDDMPATTSDLFA